MLQKPHRLTVKLISCSLAFGLFALGPAIYPAFSEPATDDSTVQHVFPGAEPIKRSSKPAESTSDPAVANPADTSVDSSSAATTEPAADATAASTGQAVESDISSDKTFEELEAEQQHKNEVAAANAYQHWELACKYFGKWELDLAEVEYDEAIRYQPEMKIAHRDVCLVSMAKFNLGRSLAEFMMVVGLGDPIPLTPNEGHALDIKAMHQHYKRALAWGKNYNWDNSIAELQWAMLYSPHDYSIHHSLAFAYASKGDLERADEEYSKTFAEQPNDGYAHADYANLLADKGDTARAEAEMKKAVALDPNAAALHIDLGWIAEGRGDTTTAATEFQKAVELSPKHANLWNHLGRLRERNSDRAGAETAYEKALQLDPAFTDAKTNLARVKQQTEQEEQDNNNEALPANMHHVS